MLASKKTRRGVIGAVVLASVLAVSGYALTDTLLYTGPPHAGASTSVPTQQLTATNVHYVLDSTTPTNVDGIEFDLSNPLTPPGTFVDPFVYVSPDAGTTWYSCTTTGAGVTGAQGTIGLAHPECDTTTGTPLTAAAVTGFEVVAAD